MPQDRKTRLWGLITQGGAIPLIADGHQPVVGDKRVEEEEFYAWLAQAVMFLRASWAGTAYSVMFETQVREPRQRHVDAGVGILRGLYADLLEEEGGDETPPAILTQDEREQLEVVVGQVRSAFDDNALELDRDDAAEFESDLQTLEDQTRSPRPKREIVRVALRSVHAFINRPIPAGFVGGAVLLAAQALLHALG